MAYDSSGYDVTLGKWDDPYNAGYNDPNSDFYRGEDWDKGTISYWDRKYQKNPQDPDLQKYLSSSGGRGTLVVENGHLVAAPESIWTKYPWLQTVIGAGGTLAGAGIASALASSSAAAAPAATSAVPAATTAAPTVAGTAASTAPGWKGLILPASKKVYDALTSRGEDSGNSGDSGDYSSETSDSDVLNPSDSNLSDHSGTDWGDILSTGGKLLSGGATEAAKNNFDENSSYAAYLNALNNTYKSGVDAAVDTPGKLHKQAMWNDFIQNYNGAAPQTPGGPNVPTFDASAKDLAAKQKTALLAKLAEANKAKIPTAPVADPYKRGGKGTDWASMIGLGLQVAGKYW